MPAVLMKDGGVDSVFGDEDRSGIGAFGMFGRNDHLASAHFAGVIVPIGSGDIETALIIADVRRPVASAAFQRSEL